MDGNAARVAAREPGDEQVQSLADFLITRVPAISRDVSTSLDMTKSEGCVALLDVVRRNLELMAIGVAEINRVRDFVILEFKFDSALL